MSQARASWWFTPAEIARLGLPGLPNDGRRVRDLARAEGWADRAMPDGAPLGRRRNARGGGMEYHAALFPTVAQEVLAIRKKWECDAPIAGNDTGSAEAEAWAWYEQQPEGIKAEAERRIAILAEIEALAATALGKTAATREIARKHSVSPSTLANWQALVGTAARENWLPRLAPRYRGGGKEIEIDPGAWQALKSDYLRPEKPAFAACYSRVLEEYAIPRGITLPSCKTLQRRMEREISRALKKAKREGREAERRLVPPQRRTVADLHAMQVVNIDGHTFDVFVQWEDGSIGRPVMDGIHDVYSRKLLSHRIGQTENTELARMVFADLFRDYGIPSEAVLDNGRAFASKAMTGGQKTRNRFKIKDSDPTGILTALGVRVHWTLPYRGSSKPIERAWRDLCESIAKHPAVAGAYTGNKPDAKPENYKEKAIPIAVFREHVARQIALHNARPGRQTEMAQGQSFDAVFARSYAASPIGKASEAQLRFALLVAEDRRCSPIDGSIMLAGNKYWSEELIELAGEKVSVRCDPDNLHTEVHVYRLSGAYVGAAPVIEKTGFLDKDGAAKRAKLEKGVRRKRRELETAQDLLTADQLAELYATPTDPASPPSAGVVRAVRYRGHVAAALKPSPQVASEPADTPFIDAFTAGTNRLRVVE